MSSLILSLTPPALSHANRAASWLVSLHSASPSASQHPLSAPVRVPFSSARRVALAGVRPTAGALFDVHVSIETAAGVTCVPPLRVRLGSGGERDGRVELTRGEPTGIAASTEVDGDVFAFSATMLWPFAGDDDDDDGGGSSPVSRSTGVWARASGTFTDAVALWAAPANAGGAPLSEPRRIDADGGSFFDLHSSHHALSAAHVIIYAVAGGVCVGAAAASVRSLDGLRSDDVVAAREPLMHGSPPLIPARADGALHFQPSPTIAAPPANAPTHFSLVPPAGHAARAAWRVDAATPLTAREAAAMLPSSITVLALLYAGGEERAAFDGGSSSSRVRPTPPSWVPRETPAALARAATAADAAARGLALLAAFDAAVADSRAGRSGEMRGCGLTAAACVEAACLSAEAAARTFSHILGRALAAGQTAAIPPAIISARARSSALTILSEWEVAARACVRAIEIAGAVVLQCAGGSDAAARALRSAAAAAIAARTFSHDLRGLRGTEPLDSAHEAAAAVDAAAVAALAFVSASDGRNDAVFEGAACDFLDELRDADFFGVGGGDDDAMARLTLAILQRTEAGGEGSGRFFSDAFCALLSSALAAAAAGVSPRAAGPAVARVIGHVIDSELTAVLAGGGVGEIAHKRVAEAILAAAPSSALRVAAHTAPYLVLNISASIYQSVARACSSGAPSTALMTALLKRADAAALAAAAQLSAAPTHADVTLVPAGYAISALYAFARSSPSPDTAAPLARALASAANAVRDSLPAARMALRAATLLCKSEAPQSGGSHVALVPAALAVSRACAASDAAHDHFDVEDVRVFADGVSAWAMGGAITPALVTSALAASDASSSPQVGVFIADVAAFRGAFAALAAVSRARTLRSTVVAWALHTAANAVECGGSGAALESVIVALCVLTTRTPHTADGGGADADDAEHAVALLAQIAQRRRGRESGVPAGSASVTPPPSEGLWPSLVDAALSRLCARVAPAAAPALLQRLGGGQVPSTASDSLVDARPYHERLAITRGAACIRAGAAAVEAGALPAPSTAGALYAASNAVSPPLAALLSRAWADILHTATATVGGGGFGTLANSRGVGTVETTALTTAWKDGFAEGVREAAILAEGYAARASAAAVAERPLHSLSSATSPFENGSDARAAAVCFWGPCTRALGASDAGHAACWLLFPLRRGASTAALAAALKRELPHSRVFGPDAGYAIGFTAVEEVASGARASGASGAVFCGAGAAASAAASFGVIDRGTGALCFPAGNPSTQDYIFVFPANPSNVAPSSSPPNDNRSKQSRHGVSLDDVDVPSVSDACALTRDTEYTVLIASSLSFQLPTCEEHGRYGQEMGPSDFGVYGAGAESAGGAAATRFHEHALLRATGPCIHSGEFSLDEHDPGVSFFSTPPRATAPLWSLRLAPSLLPPSAGDAAMPGVRARVRSLEPQAFAPAAERAALLALSAQPTPAKKAGRTPAAALLRGIQSAAPRPSLAQLNRQPPDATLNPAIDFAPILSVGAVVERGGGGAGDAHGAASSHVGVAPGAVADAFDPRASFASGPRSSRAALVDYAALLIRAREKRMTTMRRDFCRAEAARAAAGVAADGGDDDDGAVPDWDKAVPRIVHAGALLLDAHVAKSLGAFLH